MKQRKQVFFLIGVMLLMISGCRDKSSLLIRTWKVNDLKYTSIIPKEMIPTIDQSIENLRKSFRLTYNADGTYITEMNGQVLKGKWKLNYTSSLLISTAEDGSTKNFKIIQLSKEVFSFEADEGGEQVIFHMIPA